MQDTTQSPRQVLIRRFMLIGAGVIVVALVAAGTVLFLKNVIPKKESNDLTSAISAEELIARYSVPGAIKGLSDNLYDQQLDDGTKVPLVHKLTGREYVISTQTPENVLFYGKNLSAQDDVGSIQDQTTTFMNKKGYKKINNPKTKDAGTQARVTYASDSAVCQLTSSGAQVPEGSPVSHQLACAENTAIDAEYVATEKLLELYAKAKERPKFTEAVRSSVTEGNKSYATLQLITAVHPPSLLFAALDDKWSYIGNLNGTAGESTGKYVLTPEVKAKLNDPKYNGFLTRYIVGTTS